MLRAKVIETISKALNTDDFTLLTPTYTDFGDYALHVTHVTRNMKHETLKDEKQFIQTIITSLSKNKLFGKVEKKGEFINFFMNSAILVDELSTVFKKRDDYGKIKAIKPLRVNLEYGQPNTHKLPHIGHLFSYLYGESLSRIFEFTGHTVYRANYQGDVGLHVAKCLFQIKNDPFDKTQKLKTLSEKVQFLQKCYQEGAQLYENDETAKKEVNEINKKIYQKNSSIIQLWRQTCQWSLDYYKEFEKKLGINYDRYYFESETAPVGKKIVQKHINDIFEKSEGAVVFRGEKYGLHTRVFINQHGNPTYEAKDVGLIDLKQKDWPFDRAVLTTAAEQNAYYAVVKKSIELIFPDLKGKIEHIGFGMIDLKSGKMSSRTGKIVSAMDLVDVINEEIEPLVNKKGKESIEIENIVNTVAMAAIKYSFLKSEARKNMAFDIDKSIAKNGASGPYLLYTYARCMSILAKMSPSVILPTPYHNNQLVNEELALLRTFFRFPEVVADAAQKYAPHLICTYLFDLSQKFSVFYESCPILKADKSTKQFRLMLTSATAQILKNGLYLLGIEAMERI